MSGSKPGERRGGRKKGSLNKRTITLGARDRELVDQAAAAGETPLEYMLRVMRDRSVDHERRDRMAAQVAPYVHARLNSIEAKITHRDEMTENELRRTIAADLAAIGVQGTTIAGTDGEEETGPSGRLN